MKTITQEALTRTALAKGGTLAVGGHVVNSSGARVALVPPAPKPPPTNPAPLATDDASLAQLTKATAALTDMQRGLVAMVAQLAMQMKAEPEPEAPVKEWVFTIERDKVFGLLTGIKARAVR